MSIRIILIEDHHVFRIGLKYVLDHSKGIKVVGEATDLQSAARVLSEANADVVILDLDLPDGEGLEPLEVVKQHAGAAAVLVLSSYDGQAWADRVLAAGGAGFVNKAAQFPEVVAAVNAVHSGRSIVCVSNRDRVLRHDDPTPPRKTASRAVALSAREQEVLTRIARGQTNQQAADELFLSVKTIETYRSRMMRKLGFSSRAELFEYARQSGILAT